ncbi:MAG TPA: hypothetical protein VFO01_11860 [Trebonia sp.]|nr:hypothetical protein [Trebonia sp.]
MTGAVVDTPSAREFQQEIASRVSPADLAAIAGDLDRKSRSLRELLAPGADHLDRPALRQVLRWVFATRRRADAILDEAGPERLGFAIAGLLDPAVPVAERFDRFDSFAAGLPGCGLHNAGFELAGELLHFTDPGLYWLWTRWLWDPATATGALPLVTTDDIDLAEGASRGEIYLTVGRATAFLDETGKAAGFTDAGPGLFGTDVFLAAVYGVYMFTVLRMRMTQEFTRLVPPLPDLIRRLLGVYHLEV